MGPLNDGHFVEVLCMQDRVTFGRELVILLCVPGTLVHSHSVLMPMLFVFIPPGKLDHYIHNVVSWIASS